MSDKFEMKPKPELMGDTGIHRLFGDELKPAAALAAVMQRLEKIMHKPPQPEPTNVAELMFHTSKRRRPDIYECRNCNYQFPQEAACPECSSTNLGLFMRAPSSSEVRAHTGDRESALTELDPEWRERFHGDAERAWEFYEAPQTRLVGLGKTDQPPESIDVPREDPDDVPFDSGLDDDPN